MKLQWNQIDWKKAEEQVNRLQIRIVKATLEQKLRLVKRLQYLITNSFYAKALAVKRVVSNRGKKTPGIDGEFWKSDKEKVNAVRSLDCQTYHAKPLKRVYIEKFGKKEKRPLGIPTMRDRAMQALYLMALAPVAETTADANSYGFRKERSTADAVQQCFNDLARTTSPQWILEGDIKGCFDHISHEWLLDNIPMDKVMLRKWLKCGFVFNKELFPTEEGTPQGGIISPTLANMTLDGLQTMLAEKYHKKFVNRKTTYYPKVHLVRYADDFIITGRSKEALEEIKPLVVDFLKERGLTLSEEKTKITHIDDGFDFLGYNIRKYKGVLLIKPSKKSLKKFMQKIRGIIDSNKGSKQESLIRLLNPVITGWVNYYKNCVASDTFRKADYLIFEKLWQWAKRRHPKKGKYWIADRYFTRVKNRNWCFVANFKKGKTDDRIALKRLYDTKITRYVKIKGEANPFDPEWTEYFEKRKTYKMLQSLNGRKSLLYMWERQNHLCPVCGKPIDKEHPWGTSQQIVNGKKVNFLLHDSCRRKVIQTNKM